MTAKIAAAYIRVSTDDQLEFSPDSQMKKIREYAAKNELLIPHELVFIDEGISGRKAEKRPAFMKMISLAKTKPKPFDIILVWKFSRFARNREDSIVYKSMLRKQCGIDVVSVSEQLGEDKTAILMEAMLEAMDEYYSVNLAEEVKRGMNEKFSRGGVVSQPPFGYRMGDNGFVPDEKNAPVVRMIFENFLSGMSVRKIAMKLNEMGVRSVKGNKFESRTVEYILCNPTYTGKLRRNTGGKLKNDRFHRSPETVIVDGRQEPIISEKLYQAANKKLLENRKRQVRYSRQTGADFMLRGLVRCSSCGATLVQSVRGISLQCHRYAKGQCTASHSVTIAKINEAVLEKLESDLEGCAFSFEISRNSFAEENNVNSILLEKEYKKLERIREAFEAGIDSLEEYSLNKARIKDRIALLEKGIPHSDETEYPEKLRAGIAEIISRLKGTAASENEKNTFLRSIISEILFDKKNMTIQIKYLPVF